MKGAISVNERLAQRIAHHCYRLTGENVCERMEAIILIHLDTVFPEEQNGNQEEARSAKAQNTGKTHGTRDGLVHQDGTETPW